eukprot:TRINITY_DN1794_c0_g3_i1.p1 TRINITY_DN1794_c0_g3~~TRINITY_DN1794_c0_g3_i1.p1  ORF type:complete len:106 (+),score=46.66 TRINITY_DN1794_c0_g3_i1:84-401(+)
MNSFNKPLPPIIFPRPPKKIITFWQNCKTVTLIVLTSFIFGSLKWLAWKKIEKVLVEQNQLKQQLNDLLKDDWVFRQFQIHKILTTTVNIYTNREHPRQVPLDDD